MSDLRSRYDACYSQRVLAFIQDVNAADPTNMPAPLLPLYGSGYETSPLKAGFIGQDTREWGNMRDFISAIRSDPIGVFRNNEEFFDKLPFTKWTNNFGTSFWDTVFKLLAGFHGIADWKRLKRRQEDDILKRFFWANTNSVEVYEDTPQKKGVPFEQWRKFKDASDKHLDSLERLIDVFTPHVIVIMDWDPSSHFLKSSPTWTLLGNHLDYAVDPTGRTHIFKTAHPTWLNRNRLHKANVEAIVQKFSQVKAPVG